MARTIDFAFDLGEEVLVTPIGMRGWVDGLTFDSLGPQYRVVYWNDGDRFVRWLYAYELRTARPE